MSYIMVDVESDGPIPGDYSMIAFAAADCDNKDNFFVSKLKPISDKYLSNSLSISGFTREECFSFNDPQEEMLKFGIWLNQFDRKTFVSDNNGYDWQFINYYFHHFIGENPFGYSSQNLGSLYKGFVHNIRRNFKHLRKTKHDHNPLNDVWGNIEAFQEIKKMGMRF